VYIGNIENPIMFVIRIKTLYSALVDRNVIFIRNFLVDKNPVGEGSSWILYAICLQNGVTKWHWFANVPRQNF